MRDWLKPARIERGLSPADMAKALDISENYYFAIESGRRQRKMDITLVSKLSGVLKMPLGRIIDLEMRKKEDA